jgi:hypothetical protein
MKESKEMTPEVNWQEITPGCTLYERVMQKAIRQGLEFHEAVWIEEKCTHEAMSASLSDTAISVKGQ